MRRSGRAHGQRGGTHAIMPAESPYKRVALKGDVEGGGLIRQHGGVSLIKARKVRKHFPKSKRMRD
jgi:hypothetical protein